MHTNILYTKTGRNKTNHFLFSCWSFDSILFFFSEIFAWIFCFVSQLDIRKISGQCKNRCQQTDVKLIIFKKPLEIRLNKSFFINWIYNLIIFPFVLQFMARMSSLEHRSPFFFGKKHIFDNLLLKEAYSNYIIIWSIDCVYLWRSFCSDTIPKTLSLK